MQRSPKQEWHKQGEAKAKAKAKPKEKEKDMPDLHRCIPGSRDRGGLLSPLALLLFLAGSASLCGMATWELLWRFQIRLLASRGVLRCAVL